MINELKNIEKTILLDLLKNPLIWNTLDVDYHHPRVERLWTQIEDSRLMLHVIHPCESSESLYHPHAWPSVMHVLKGKYEMGLAMPYSPGFIELHGLNGYWRGNKSTLIRPTDSHWIKEICRLELSGDNYYSMLEPKGWHSVRPINEPSYTIMYSGPLYDEHQRVKINKTWGELKPLSDERKLEILKIFLELFNGK